MLSSRRAIRLRRRAFSVATNAINALFLPLLSPLVSLLVIRLASAELWGAFVQVLLLTQLVAHVLVWGNKEYLLREFSRQPARIKTIWQGTLLTRALLIVGFAPIAIALSMPWWRAALLTLWALATTIDQSHEVLVAYHKAFVGQMLVDLGGLGLLLAGVLWPGGGPSGSLTLDGLIGLFALVEAAKAGALLLWLRPCTLRRAALRINLAYFRLALPFFLLGLSGMLQSRIDQYCVTIWLSRREVAHYQVLTNFLLYAQALAAIALVPFLKGMYRLRTQVLLRLSLTLLLSGLALIGPIMGALALIMARLYNVDLPLSTLLLGGLSVLPIYYYLPIIYALYKVDRQSAVLRINLLGIAVNLLLSLLLLPTWRMDGGLAANLIAQLAMLLAYQRQSATLRVPYAAALPKLPPPA
jgi:O-antigen/teichoic acid export membrane protein